MYTVVMVVQILSIAGLLLECGMIFTNMKEKVHFYLLFSCGATLINSIGYLLELMSRSQEAYLMALKFSYFGKIWIGLGMLLFIAELVHIRIPRGLTGICATINVFIYAVVLTIGYNDLYYRYMRFEVDGNFPKFVHENGVVHDIWTVMMVFYIVFGMAALLITYFREKNPIARKRLYLVALTLLIEGGFTLMELFSVIRPLEEYYDVTMIGFPLGTILIFLSIVHYDLLNTEKIAKDYVIDELSEGVIATDMQGQIQFFNRPALTLFPNIQLTPDEVMENLDRSIEMSEPIRMNDRIYSPEKNDLYQKGVRVGTIYSIIDDTDYYAYCDNLEEQKSIADRANSAKSAFLANMSHEIRTPLNAVLGMDEMILRESKEDSIQTYARDIRTAGRTLLSLINDILDFSKIEEGRMEILPTQYELSSLIGDLVNMIRDRADKKNLAFKVEVDSEIPHLLYGDEIRIKQVALNLLTNAVKYTEKGEVHLAVGYMKSGDDEIMLSFKVSDTGIGMKQEDMDKLFSPFSRIEENRNRSIEGTGLGMSIVKQLLALMDSELDVKSVYGEGSEFSFEIKQKVEKWDNIGDFTERYNSESLKSDEYVECFHAPGAHVLCVDDTEVNLVVFKSLLKRTQIHVDTALSGREAIAMAGKKQYDVIFIDHMMPEMNGIETLYRLREDVVGAPICIALTANAVSGAREMYLEAGFTDYLSKPIDGRRLEEMLLEYLPDDKIIKDIENDEDTDIDKEQGKADESAASERLIPSWLKESPELDVDAGISNCSDEESFLSVLQTFHQTAASKADEIQSLYDGNDIENYTIKVHALKSSARIIGASGLSEMAKALEDAGKAGDVDTIKRDTDALLKRYRDLDGFITPLYEKGGDKPDLPDDMRKEAFQTIAEIAQSMDFGMLEDVLKDLKGYALTPDDEKAVKSIEDMLMNLDWDGISELAAKM